MCIEKDCIYTDKTIPYKIHEQSFLSLLYPVSGSRTLVCEHEFELFFEYHSNPVAFFVENNIYYNCLKYLDYDIVEKLILYGVDIDYRKDGKNALGILFSRDDNQRSLDFIKTYSLLIAAGVDDFDIDSKGNSIGDVISSYFSHLREDSIFRTLTYAFNREWATLFYERYQTVFEQNNIRFE